MTYILARKAKALDYRIGVSSHVTHGAYVVLNEKEVRCAAALADEPTLEGKVSLLEGRIFNSAAELLHYLAK